MSSSEQDSKIDLLEPASSVEKKVKKGQSFLSLSLSNLNLFLFIFPAFCEEGTVENNGVLSFVKFVLFPLFSLKNISTFVIKRPAKFGGDITFSSYEEVEKSFVEKTLFPLDLKAGVTDALNSLLEPIRQKFTSKELVELTKKAYPEAPKVALFFLFFFFFFFSAVLTSDFSSVCFGGFF